MLKSRVITAVVLLVLFLAALFLLPAAAWALLVLVMVMQGAVEWARLSGLSGRKANVYWALTLALMGGMLVLDSYTTPAQQDYTHLGVYLVSALLWLVIVPSWLMAGWKVRRPLLMALTGWAVLLPTGLAMLDLREADPSPWMLLFVMCLVWVADISAYFAGRRFGKNKLAPDISPGKTWEGVAGAVFGVSAYVVLVWSFSPYFSTREILPPLLLASWWWVALAVIGDLFESAVKRQAGVKDSGALLPGHGGLLDRIDALTSTLPLAALAMLLQRIS
ncbi:phosphatidate cytidylyltransferase [Ferrigenium kumadai]|uniref:Phosphatidate cytidylyltransferase n=1 Tax=Ferrigenium kumadai TaxID=1682490 RepID=A0AAN1SZ84_9PROT|nr:phosphatidate cytidylyltransferase [Ferrigenium kumadai]BBI99502.1 phosphatidate cytidylyltransferase [Ferrigenium kumadai]